MNQDRVHEMLEAIEPAPAPFTVVFSGRTNKKVNGLYKPAKAEIILHTEISTPTTSSFILQSMNMPII